eukprot:TRINITY_DN850_c0_g1_i1.p2 TRINITY_DN850_c0_g1~~TRINITY_DN850_c0_g1_i1.p2  ORF type:complete len:107 (+),score=1.63 TRINITY_DN850_c0_g1_i1:460-780(+)
MENPSVMKKPFPKGANVVGCKWVYKIKRDEHGNVGKFKSRLVAQGFSQKGGIDFHETFSPIARATTFRLLLSIAATKNWKVYQADISSAFLNGPLQEEVWQYMSMT